MVTADGETITMPPEPAVATPSVRFVEEDQHAPQRIAIDHHGHSNSHDVIHDALPVPKKINSIEDFVDSKIIEEHKAEKDRLPEAQQQARTKREDRLAKQGLRVLNVHEDVNHAILGPLHSDPSDGAFVADDDSGIQVAERDNLDTIGEGQTSHGHDHHHDTLSDDADIENDEPAPSHGDHVRLESVEG